MNLNKVRYIELFGISGSGKTYVRNEIKKILKKSNLKILDRRELIISEYDSVIELNFLEKQIINYFRLLNFIKKKFKIRIKKNIELKKKIHNKKNSFKILNKITVNFKNKYENICKKILLKDNKSKKIYKFILKVLKKSTNANKELYHFWFVEMLAANTIYEKIKIKANFIYFPDEGFIQRTYLINRLTSPKNASIIREYLKLIFKAELILNINSNISKIYNIYSNRKINNSEFRTSKKDIDQMIEFNKKLIKNYINFNFKTIKNNSKLNKSLNNKFNY